MDADGTTPRMESVESSLEQRPRATQEAKAEGRDGSERIITLPSITPQAVSSTHIGKFQVFVIPARACPVHDTGQALAGMTVFFIVEDV